jgi:hypothetical protein
MPNKKKKLDYEPHRSAEKAQACHVPGCNEAGLYKAPKSNGDLNSYCWFCLEHIRERNQRWDYFAGMDRDEIEQFLKDAVTGHRPTWTRETQVSTQYKKLQDALYEFLNMGAKRPQKQHPELPAKLRKALATMDMDYPYSMDGLKGKYRVLVKKHHPDVNRGNKQSEELFKQITSSYHYLMEYLKTSASAAS